MRSSRVKYQPIGYSYKETIAMAHTIYENEDRICGCCKHKHAACVSGISTLIYATLIIVHEIALEKAFGLRNYVVIAFCIVWFIFSLLMFMALFKDAQFLLLPWLMLSVLLTPMFVVAIVAGCRVLAICMSESQPTSCVHELHIFGTLHHTAAIGKLALLVLMFFSNLISILVVYKNFMLMRDCRSSYTQSKVDVHAESRSTFRYHKFEQDIEDNSNDTVLDELLTVENTQQPP